MPPETELIKQQMGQTRTALTEKLEMLENKVFGTVHDTTGTISNTVQQVGSSVRETVREVGAAVRETTGDVRASVREAVSSARDAVDLSRQMHEHPWLMMGGSVFAGYVGGLLLDNLERGRLPSLPSLSAPEKLLPEGSELREKVESAPPSRRTGSSFLRALVDTFAPELDKLKRAALGTALGMVRDRVGEAVPAHLKENFSELMNRVTEKLGGEPPPPGAMFGSAGAEQDEHNGSEFASSRRFG
ncbi:MAG TPA: hypothetical protein VH682_00740 [Gemmataceae bacterium]|jgi:ElaB/YqjD/DUF883 family membrane-anchored ribosome-binding protein